jgi:pyruvate formate lyase activating enzyme
MTDPENTSAAGLLQAARIGKEAGLRYVYAGNLPGNVGDLENTSCPQCQAVLIERYGYLIQAYHLTSSGSCPTCGSKIPGRWDAKFEHQITPFPYHPSRRRGTRRRVGL